MKQFGLGVPGLYLTLGVSRTTPEQDRQAQRMVQVSFDEGFADWQAASDAARGYAAPDILARAQDAARRVARGEAAYERDTVVFDRIQMAYPLLAWLLESATRSDGVLSVMDFGGALGSSYRQNQGWLGSLRSLHWGVVEQPQFVATGQAEFETDVLKFFYTPKDCFDALRPNFLLLSSVLQYIERPHELLDSLLALAIPNVLIDRTMAQFQGRGRVAVQHVPPSIYPASYPVWMLDASALQAQFAAHGYEIVDCFDPHPGSTFGGPDNPAPYVGWFLRKRQSSA